MAFDGWPPEAFAFYAGLEADNAKPYWTANRATFDDAVHAPMVALVDELEPRFGPGRILRPYRDVRFTKDKSPYRTSHGAMVGDVYVQISARGIGAGGGYYHLAPDQLERYRAAVAADETGEDLGGRIAGIEAAGIEVSGADPLKTAPRGYPPDHPRIALLRYRGLIAWKQWPVEDWISTGSARDRIVEALDTSAPLREWLRAEVGPSTVGHRRGRR
jgi:uncharacterized protein (TIGR02453 family)